ncbi:hypothetical protein [Methanobacterium petrolearium]|uniref:hypothetical protein n=1 Tax=Methanobacterium petrolearium TaxID=710190 RepID=UPI001AEA74E8|nr:hypothetical protein [Methanobacterium petrolearium]MBP1946700.1 peptidoglycan hydrolase CwlO-like protein [Methanobacterium petrolearium]BDZ70947.1 hypothetical protein GCM10025861_14640 [Methanobacterium petrolearium]
MGRLIMSFYIILLVFLMLQPVMAAEQSSLGDIKNDADQALQNVSKVTNDTAKEVQNTLNPIQDIVNTISSIVQQIQQILQDLSYIINGGYYQ